MVLEESIIGFTSGAVYGLTSLVTGHPLDTLKTKMQAQNAHLQGSSFRVFMNTVKSEGIVGLYRGCVPPLLGASLLRSVQFGVYATVFSAISPEQSSFPKFNVFGIPNTILVAGMASGLGRALVECPLEVAKIRRQIGKSWSFLELYQGLGVNIARNVPLLASFFVFLDQASRIDMPASWRPFLTGSICSTMAWTLVFPLDVVKSQIQADSGTETKGSTSFAEKVRSHYQRFGVKGFFRGYGPACTRSLIANGCSMVALFYTKQQMESYFADQRREKQENHPEKNKTSTKNRPS